jgi:hypothetical protein
MINSRKPSTPRRLVDHAAIVTAAVNGAAQIVAATQPPAVPR